MPPRLATKRNLTRIAVIASVVLWYCACSPKPPSAAVPVEVSVVTVTPHPVTFPEDYVAQTEADPSIERHLKEQLLSMNDMLLRAARK